MHLHGKIKMSEASLQREGKGSVLSVVFKFACLLH
jgi:hypothetical protein